MRARHTLAGVLAALSLAAAASAQQQPPQQPETPSDAPIRIESNQNEFLQKEGRGFYTGNVVVTRGNARLTTDKLSGFCAKPANGAAAGASANQECDIDPLVAEGNVLYAAPDVKIRGDKAVYQTGSGIITITGDVIVSRGDEGVMRGTEAVYNVDEGKVKVTAGTKPVLTIITPKKKDTATPPAAPATPPN